MNRYPLTFVFLRSVSRLNRQARAAEARAVQAEHECAELVAEVCRLAEDNARLRKDADLLALCIHPKRREAALALVRDRRRIDRLEVAG